MKSIRTKITLLTVCAIIVAMIAATLLGVFALRSVGHSNSEKMLTLLCQTGEKNLDSYFESVEKSVEIISTLIEEDLGKIELDQLGEHIERAALMFEKTAAGVLTYYYRIDPSVSDEKGFWYVNLDGEGFKAHEVTDISRYDTEDTSKLVWFTVPKFTGNAIWLPPYYTDNLDRVLVMSYNSPIYKGGTFIGVVGIEIDYNLVAEQVKNIKLYDNGYAFINDDEGKIICHPGMDASVITGENQPTVPDNLLSDSAYIKYTYEGVEKQAVWLPLRNGMRLNVTVPTSEINGDWQQLIYEIVGVSVVLLVLFIILTMRLAGHITKPLRKLTDAAQQVNDGNYDVKLDYNKNDEIGLLSTTFDRLISHLKVYIGDLNNLVYADALTSIHNKGAFDIFVRELQTQLESSEGSNEFAVGIFDCDDLKKINDKYGHYSGDMYIKTASHFICHIFSHSPVFRIGGDEFAVILQNEDFKNRADLIGKATRHDSEIHIVADGQRIPVRISMGITAFDPESDKTVEDVIKRADMMMYDNKRARKRALKDADELLGRGDAR